MNRVDMIRQMNEAGKQKIPFLFVIDFSGEESIFSLLDAKELPVYFSTPKHKYLPEVAVDHCDFQFLKHPIPYETYLKRFNIVQAGIRRGDSFLVNLTFPTHIDTNLTIQDIFMRSNAAYRLLIPNQLVCFSPERFVKIENNEVFSFPMKGTIDASIADAEALIMEDAKEKAEHYTIVDLIRNDLSRVADEVEVRRFRYIDRVQTNGKTLLQVSSEIAGKLPNGFQNRLGDIIFSLLPAGSICGAPKDSTLSIIRRTELGERGFYTGIFGVFDGENLDSAVLIRYIEQRGDELFFRSGGGITSQSEPESEYQELIDKVYVPFT
jgi:para-aminobenzoate synthetase component 1